MVELEEAPLRLFVAVVPPLDLRRKLVSMGEGLQATAWSLGLVDPRDLHLTLHFLGASPARLLDDLKREIGAICHARRPFDLRAGGLGCFPDDADPRMLWVGVLDRAGRLRELFDALRRVLDAYRLFKLTADFTPHFTLARVERLSASWDPRLLRAVALQWDDLGAFGVEEILLQRSRSNAEDGPRYETMAAFGLGGG